MTPYAIWRMLRMIRTDCAIIRLDLRCCVRLKLLYILTFHHNHPTIIADLHSCKFFARMTLSARRVSQV